MFKELELPEICALLKTAKTIAVVGISNNPGRISRIIAERLVDMKYKVAGVNPASFFIENIPMFKSLTDIPHQIDIINVFRKPETIGELVPDIIKLKPKCLWLQEGIRNEEAAELVYSNGIQIVQDKCIWVYYNRCLQ